MAIAVCWPSAVGVTVTCAWLVEGPRASLGRTATSPIVGSHRASFEISGARLSERYETYPTPGCRIACQPGEEPKAVC